MRETRRDPASDPSCPPNTTANQAALETALTENDATDNKTTWDPELGHFLAGGDICSHTVLLLHAFIENGKLRGIHPDHIVGPKGLSSHEKKFEQFAGSLRSMALLSGKTEAIPVCCMLIDACNDDLGSVTVKVDGVDTERNKFYCELADLENCTWSFTRNSEYPDYQSLHTIALTSDVRTALNSMFADENGEVALGMVDFSLTALPAEGAAAAVSRHGITLKKAAAVPTVNIAVREPAPVTVPFPTAAEHPLNFAGYEELYVLKGVLEGEDDPAVQALLVYCHVTGISLDDEQGTEADDALIAYVPPWDSSFSTSDFVPPPLTPAEGVDPTTLPVYKRALANHAAHCLCVSVFKTVTLFNNLARSHDEKTSAATADLARFKLESEAYTLDLANRKAALAATKPSKNSDAKSGSEIVSSLTTKASAKTFVALAAIQKATADLTDMSGAPAIPGITKTGAPISGGALPGAARDLLDLWIKSQKDVWKLIDDFREHLPEEEQAKLDAYVAVHEPRIASTWRIDSLMTMLQIADLAQIRLATICKHLAARNYQFTYKSLVDAVIGSTKLTIVNNLPDVPVLIKATKSLNAIAASFKMEHDLQTFYHVFFESIDYEGHLISNTLAGLGPNQLLELDRLYVAYTTGTQLKSTIELLAILNSFMTTRGGQLVQEKKIALLKEKLALLKDKKSAREKEEEMAATAAEEPEDKDSKSTKSTKRGGKNNRGGGGGGGGGRGSGGGNKKRQINGKTSSITKKESLCTYDLFLKPGCTRNNCPYLHADDLGYGDLSEDQHEARDYDLGNHTKPSILDRAKCIRLGVTWSSLSGDLQAANPDYPLERGTTERVFKPPRFANVGQRYSKDNPMSAHMSSTNGDDGDNSSVVSSLSDLSNSTSHGGSICSIMEGVPVTYDRAEEFLIASVLDPTEIAALEFQKSIPEVHRAAVKRRFDAAWSKRS
jgi:uncharacterized membrane protein YgcG